MTYFAIICSTKKIKVNLQVSEVLITHIRNRGKASMTLHIGADHSNNLLIILKLPRYDISCNSLQHKKKFKVNSEVSQILITYVTKCWNDVTYRGYARGNAKVMLHIGAVSQQKSSKNKSFQNEISFAIICSIKIKE